MTGLTNASRPSQTKKTTSYNGTTAPRKPCGIFVSAVHRSGLLIRHQGDNTTPVSRIGRLRFTRRNKPKVRLETNKPGRLYAVVAAGVCLPIAWAAASVRSSTIRSN
jgi:hypothetical protein